MGKITLNSPLLPHMFCSVFGHHYQVTKKVTYHVKDAILERIHNSRAERSKKKMITSSIY